MADAESRVAVAAAVGWLHGENCGGEEGRKERGPLPPSLPPSLSLSLPAAADGRFLLPYTHVCLNGTFLFAIKVNLNITETLS